MIKEYLAYLKDNPEKYWFKAKLYGWGWVPFTWQGWLITIVYLSAVVLLALPLDENLGGAALVHQILPIVLLTIALTYICGVRGEKPRWQWDKSNRK